MRPPLPPEDLDQILQLTQEFWARYGGARLFITGGTGFIGSWLLETIRHANATLGSGIEVIALSRDPARAMTQAPHLFSAPGISLHQGDVSEFSFPAGQFDLCIHGAADVAFPDRTASPLAVFDAAVQGTRRVLTLAAERGVSRFLLASSGAVYGPAPDLAAIPEDYPGAANPLEPGTAYAQGKRAAEWLTCTCAHQAGFSASIARIFALLGPNIPLNGPFAAGNFIRDALNKQAIDIQGDGRPLRSYLYMADCCVWLLRILMAGRSSAAYNVGSEHAVSICELAQAVARSVDDEIPIRIHTPANPGAPVPRYLPDTHQTRHELGLAEYTPFAPALRKTLDWTRLAGKYS